VGAIKSEDVPVAIQTDDAEVRMQEVGEMTVAFFRLKEGAGLRTRSRWAS
jgi:hypothetical protein